MNDQLKHLYDILPSCTCKEFKSAVGKIQSMTDNEEFLDKCLMQAADHGRLDIIKMIYEEFDHHYSAKEECFPYCAGDTPMLHAADRGNEQIVKYLLEHKANPFAVDSHGANAAINAIASGNVELAKFLIEECQIAWQGYTFEGTSALMFSLTSKSPRMFGYTLSLGGLKYNHPPYGGEEGVDDYPLLKHAGDPFQTKTQKWMKMLNGKYKKILMNYQNNDCSALCLAAEQGDLKKVKRLIDSYEYPIVSAPMICSACKGGHIDIFHYFINELHLPLPENALAYAVTGGKWELVDELIFVHNQNIYQTTADGETLLHLAVRDGNAEKYDTLYIITRLLDWGRLDPNATCYTGSVMDLACRKGNLPIVERIVSYGAKIDIDAVCTAAQNGNVEILKFLLDKNPELTLDTQGQNGTTPLHEAIKGGSLEVIKYLLENGARTDIADDDGCTAEQCAEMHHISLSK